MIFQEYQDKLDVIATRYKVPTVEELIADYEETFVGTLKEHQARVDAIQNKTAPEFSSNEKRGDLEIGVLGDFAKALQLKYDIKGRDVNHRAIIHISTKNSPNDLQKIEESYKLLAEFVLYQSSSSYR